MANAEQCGVKGCDQAARAVLDGEGLCQGHFISVCYTQLERYEEMQKEHRLSVSDGEMVRRFINQCSRQADEIEHTTKDLDNLDRARDFSTSFFGPTNWAVICGGVPGRWPPSPCAFLVTGLAVLGKKKRKPCC